MLSRLFEWGCIELATEQLTGAIPPQLGDGPIVSCTLVISSRISARMPRAVSLQTNNPGRALLPTNTFPSMEKKMVGLVNGKRPVGRILGTSSFCDFIVPARSYSSKLACSNGRVREL